MKNTFGNSVCLTVFGESHGAGVGCVIDGLAPGLPVREDSIAASLSRRRPDALSTARREEDSFRILSGVFQGRTTGTPLTVFIPNEDARSGDYTPGILRPSHADYSGHMKYHGFEDYRGGGHFSGRVTSAIVAAGAIFTDALAGLGIRLASHILSCGGVNDRGFDNIPGDIEYLSASSRPVLDDNASKRMDAVVSAAKAQGDSVGGITETAVIGLPAGLGEPWFDSVEGVLSHALFSIGGIKGVSFGSGFECSGMRGSEYNDALRIDSGRVVTATNHDGGINGGITNGMPVVFSCAVKPTASIALPQSSVDLTSNTDIDLSLTGRHDPAIIRRICPVIDAVTAMVLCDMLSMRCGTDVFTRGIKEWTTD